jgi:hypothetical protein
METLMLPIRSGHAESDNRLRVVFDDAVVSLPLAADATLEDVAWIFGELVPRHAGLAVAIAVILASRGHRRPANHGTDLTGASVRSAHAPG